MSVQHIGVDQKQSLVSMTAAMAERRRHATGDQDNNTNMFHRNSAKHGEVSCQAAEYREE